MGDKECDCEEERSMGWQKGRRMRAQEAVCKYSAAEGQMSRRSCVGDECDREAGRKK